MLNNNTKNMKQYAILHPIHKNKKGDYYPQPTNIKIKSQDGKIKTNIKI